MKAYFFWVAMVGASVYTLVGYFSVHTIHRLKKNACSLSERTKQMQRQLNKILIVQVCGRIGRRFFIVIYTAV